MPKKLFGTDGIRGEVNKGAIRPENFVRLGEALGYSLYRAKANRPTVLIGRDTRRSGVILEAAIEAGLLNAGADVVKCGEVPTPAVGYLTRTHGLDAGLMITASHNPAKDNGVKAFGADGFKISSAMQSEIEALVFDETDCFVDASTFGNSSELFAYQDAYRQFAISTFPKHLTLKGLKIFVDAANGAAHKLAAEVLSDLGADIVSLGNQPDGFNINLDCGAMHPEQVAKRVVEEKADLGFALDGDADRIILVDEAGKVVDGDQIMGAIGLNYHRKDKLKGGGVVATIMSNLGLEQALKAEGLLLERTPVGDRFVVECMREKGFNVGGEQSGHVVISDYVTTGDAIISALQILAIMVEEEKPASEVLDVFEPVPQLLKNVRFGEFDPLDDQRVKTAISDIQARLYGSGRLVIRKSGTEPVIRVMAEALNGADAELAVDELVALIMDVVES